MVIYQILHMESGCKYIGQTTRKPIERWKEHLYSLRKGKHCNRYLQSAWNKYGEKSFKFQIVRECLSLEELNVAEIELVEKGENLYNLGVGGNAHFQEDKVKLVIGEASKNQS